MPPDPTRVLLVGDTHGVVEQVRHATETAIKEGCQRIVQVGDFGVWPNRSNPRFQTKPSPFVRQVDAILDHAGLHLDFIDGNHDWHPWLRKQTPAADGSVPVAEHVTYRPRGHRWTWNGTRFLALGGAFSVDRASRRLGSSWWPEETITTEEATLAMAGGEVDVLICHDCPEGVNPLDSDQLWPDLPEQRLNRFLLRQVVDHTRPALVVHGHWHHRKTQTLYLTDGFPVRIEGLDQTTQTKNSWHRAWDVLEIAPPPRLPPMPSPFDIAQGYSLRPSTPEEGSQ